MGQIKEKGRMIKTQQMKKTWNKFLCDIVE